MTPVLFATWERFSREDFVLVVKLVSVIAFRYTVVSGLNPNALEPAYHEAAKAVLDGRATNLATLFERLEPIYVDDGKFRNDFALLGVDTGGRRNKLVKYILARLEEDASGPSCDADTDPATIEHILLAPAVIATPPSEGVTRGDVPQPIRRLAKPRCLSYP